MKNLYTIKEVSGALRISEGTLRDWIQYKRIPFVKIGRSVRFRSEDIERIQKEGLVTGAS